MSTVTTVAKAVAAELNRHSGFSIPFQAAFSVKPSFDLAELDTIRIVVVPKSYEVANITRASSKYVATVDIGIMQRIGRMTPEDIGRSSQAMGRKFSSKKGKISLSVGNFSCRGGNFSMS